MMLRTTVFVAILFITVHVIECGRYGRRRGRINSRLSFRRGSYHKPPGYPIPKATVCRFPRSNHSGTVRLPRPYPQGGFHPQVRYPQRGYHLQGGYLQRGYQPQAGHHPQGAGGGVTIINNKVNNNHHSGYGGGPPVYTTHDTGSSALGLFLGYSLAKATTPSYHYHNSYSNGYGYTPMYDHYSVHHYYHNKDTVPKESVIEPNSIVACVGDSGAFCPANTTSLCTTNGAVMCVASASSTIPCINEKQTNCVKSSVPCKYNNSPECKQASSGTASIAIPCISMAKVYGSISYVNNTIVVSNATMSTNQSAANNNITASNTSVANNSSTNITSVDSNSNTTVVPNVTTTKISSLVTNTTIVANATNATNEEKGRPQMFCVTVLALPAERKPTKGEKLFSQTESPSFAANALRLN